MSLSYLSKLLDIPVTTLHYRLRKLGIRPARIGGALNLSYDDILLLDAWRPAKPGRKSHA